MRFVLISRANGLVFVSARKKWEIKFSRNGYLKFFRKGVFFGGKLPDSQIRYDSAVRDVQSYINDCVGAAELSINTVSPSQTQPKRTKNKTKKTNMIPLPTPTVDMASLSPMCDSGSSSDTESDEDLDYNSATFGSPCKNESSSPPAKDAPSADAAHHHHYSILYCPEKLGDDLAEVGEDVTSHYADRSTAGRPYGYFVPPAPYSKPRLYATRTSRPHDGEVLIPFNNILDRTRRHALTMNASRRGRSSKLRDFQSSPRPLKSNIKIRTAKPASVCAAVSPPNKILGPED